MSESIGIESAGVAAAQPTYARATWLFLRLLGLVYLFAFWSIAQQILGLIGSHGIVPTAGWFAGHDAALRALPIGGAALAGLLVLGIAPVPVLAGLWVLYLVTANLMGEFLGYQWDALLLEAGLLAVALAPMTWRHRLRDAADPPRIARWLIWWLLFRLMFGSGIVKLASGDPTWRALMAMAVHYETQPLPTPLAWYAAQLPLWVQQLSTLIVLATELAVPWLIVCGRRARRAGAAMLIGLQLLIALTGNYAFFNLLTIALCVLLLDDGNAARLGVTPRVDWRRRWMRELPAAAMAVVTVPVSAVLFASQLGLAVPSAAVPLLRALDPLRSVNRYGLFAVMTTERNEIVVEGSTDGTTWKEYGFRHKPGLLTRRPTWVAPWQPRLDWQMWFAALGRYEGEPWFERFLGSLLDGSGPVRDLLAVDPFPDAPPRFVRATLYRYRFTGSVSDAAWWTREVIGEYAPPVSRR